MCDKAKLLAQWHAEERKLQKACDQLDSLNRKLDCHRARYEAAKGCQWGAMAYNMQMQMSVLEGMISMYHEYASARAAHMSALWQEVQQCPTFALSDFDTGVDMEMPMDNRL